MLPVDRPGAPADQHHSHQAQASPRHWAACHREHTSDIATTYV